MENNILQALSSMLGKNNSQPTQTSTQQNLPPLYPVEAYSVNNQPQQNQSFDNNNSSNNNLLPLLLSMMGQKGDGNVDLLSSLLSTQNGNSDTNNLLNLFSSLNKKRKDKEEENTNDKSEVVVTEGECPKNQLL